MKSTALQELAKLIFNDEETRSQFMVDPASVLSRFELTAQEKQAVLSTQAKLGSAIADSDQLAAVIEPGIIWI